MQSVVQLFQLAVPYHQAGNLHQAELLYRKILQIDPNHVETLHLLGVIAHQVGRHDLAVEYIQRALHLYPAFAAALSNLGAALISLGRHAEAEASFRQALTLEPDYSDAYNNLGLALNSLGRADEAVANYQHLLRIKPDDADGHHNLGVIYQGLGKLDDAIASSQQALRLRPVFPNALNNLGVALKDNDQRDEAIRCFREAIRLQPDHGDAHFNLSMQLLLEGRFAEGWAEYEWRWRSGEFLTHGSTRSPSSQFFWDGSPLLGRTVLIHPEQGLGDTLQFIRYASLLKQNGAGKVVFGCAPELVRLMSRCVGVDEVVTGTKMAAFEVHVFLLSLPRLLGTTSLEQIPANVPYLDCDPELVDRWRTRLAELEPDRPRLRVGIAWQGRATHKGDRWRSVRLEQFAPLAALPGVRLFSLQKGAGSEQLEKHPGLAVDLGPQLTDVADTAAVIRCLDLVISIDSAIVHLAGALGVPVWLALPRVPDWRWLLEREDSPWYPSLRLFRQTAIDLWDPVFDRIRSALEAFPNETAAETFGE